ncbi:MAG: helix-turn-helix domain-containing protein [Micropepsaceae bacterium]
MAEKKAYIETAADLGAILRKARKAQKLRLQDMALASGVSPAWLSEVERGKATARIGQVLHLARILGLKIAVE